MSFDIGGYVDVAQRIAEFIEKYPEGSLQLDQPELRDIGGKLFLVGRAYAYRTPDDPRPGVGSAWEPVPGATPYTRGSELMNLETSAWGRAIAALGIATRQGVATAQEVQLAQERRQDIDPAPAQRSAPNNANQRMANPYQGTATPKQLGMLKRLMRELGETEASLNSYTSDVLGFQMPPEGLEALSKHSCSSLIDGLMARSKSESAPPKVERVSHSDLAIQDDPWQTEPPVDPWPTDDPAPF